MVKLDTSFNGSTVALSVGLAFIGSYMTICFVEQYRQACLGARSKVLGTLDYFWVMAFTLGGVAIWSMHFVGMAALRLEAPGGTNVPFQFALGPTLCSLFAVIFLAGVGLFISSFDDLFGKTRDEIVQASLKAMAVEKEKARVASQETKKFTNSEMLRIICTYNPYKLLLGGVVAGFGVVVMHYLGMYAMYIEDVEIVWDIGIITASILIAVVAASVAFWILFRLLSLFPSVEMLRIASSVVFTVAVCGMHYTGMMAASFHYRAGGVSEPSFATHSLFSSDRAFEGGLVAAVIFTFISVMVAFCDLRTWNADLSAEIRLARNLISFIKKDPEMQRSVQNYMAIHAKGKVSLSHAAGASNQEEQCISMFLRPCMKTKVQPGDEDEKKTPISPV